MGCAATKGNASSKHNRESNKLAEARRITKAILLRPCSFLGWVPLAMSRHRAGVIATQGFWRGLHHMRKLAVAEGGDGIVRRSDLPALSLQNSLIMEPDGCVPEQNRSAGYVPVLHSAPRLFTCTSLISRRTVMTEFSHSSYMPLLDSA